jgi:hypothetical protein
MCFFGECTFENIPHPLSTHTLSFRACYHAAGPRRSIDGHTDIGDLDFLGGGLLEHLLCDHLAGLLDGAAFHRCLCLLWWVSHFEVPHVGRMLFFLGVVNDGMVRV